MTEQAEQSEVKRALQSQFEAALRMLDQSIEMCPESTWTDASERNPCWRIAYHTLFYTHLYLSASEKDFAPWEEARPNLQFMGPLPWPPYDRVDPGPPFSQSELRSYVALVREQLSGFVAQSALDADSGFEWIPFSRMELMFYNLRHLQHHTGQLADRATRAAGKPIHWVGYGDAMSAD